MKKNWYGYANANVNMGRAIIWAQSKMISAKRISNPYFTQQ